MTKEEVKTHKQHCQICRFETNHKTLCQHIDANVDEYHYSKEFSVVQCCGCDYTSFRAVFHDIESAYPIGDGEWEVPKEIDVYPRYVSDHAEIKGLFLVPDLVQNIYSETLSAVQENANTLAGLGLRGTIEAICNHQQIKGRSLDVRISSLQKAGLISANDAKRLHAIRFLGNDAAHEILKPNRNQILVALEIIDHLIANIYVLDQQMEGRLETIVTGYDEFKVILDLKVEKLNVGDELPIAGIMGKDLRRISGALHELQAALVEEINNGGYTKLSIGKLSKYMGSKDNLQHFVKI